MKTKQHGKGLNHKQVVEFSNVLAYAGLRKNREEEQLSDFEEGFNRGWEACAKFFAHQLRKELRKEEQQ